MSAKKTAQYQAYSVATRTAPKTRQVVMLYDGIIRFVRQAQQAINENRIEDRFRLLTRATDVIVGLQSSIDFERGGDIANTLNRFYTNMCVRIMSVNFNRKDGSALCDAIIDDLKQMRDIWDNIDRNLNVQAPTNVPVSLASSQTAAAAASGSVEFLA